MSNEKLKEKLFSYGLFGTKIENFTEPELQLLCREDWIEILTKEQIDELKYAFTPISNAGLQKDAILEDNLHEQFKNHYIRMDTLEWKNFVCADFNFISKEYFYLFDALVKNDGFESVFSLRERFKINAKKMFYVIKKMCLLGYIEKIDVDGAPSIKLVRNKDGSFFRGKKRDKKESININDEIVTEKTKESSAIVKKKMELITTKEINQTSNEKPKATKKLNGLIWMFPLSASLHKLVEGREDGIGSRDLQKHLGISIKKSLKILMKYANKAGGIKIVDEFEGKVRRVRFYANHAKKSAQKIKNENEPTVISMEDRINAIAHILHAEKAFVLDKKHLSRLQQLCNWKYNFDRRTIIRSAIKGDFKVFTLLGQSEQPKYCIARKNLSIDDPVIKKLISKDPKLDDFEKLLLRHFVHNQRCIEFDNGYEHCRIERFKLFYNFLTENFLLKENSKRVIFFDLSLTRKMSIDLYLKLFPCRKLNFKDEIVPNFEKNYEKILEMRNDALKNEANFQIKRLESSKEFRYCEEFGTNYEKRVSFEEFSELLSNFEAGKKIDDVKKESQNYWQGDEDDSILKYVFLSDCVFFHNSQNIFDEFVNKHKISRFSQYLADFEKFEIFKVINKNDKIFLVDNSPSWNVIEKNVGKKSKGFLMPYEARDQFFQKVRNFNRNEFYNQCIAYICCNYTGNEYKMLKQRVDIFKKAYPIMVIGDGICDEEINKEEVVDIENVIKRKLFLDETLSLRDFADQNINNLEIILKTLFERRIIVAYKGLNTLESVRLNENVKKKLDVKIDHLFLGNEIEYGRDDFYSLFFKRIYYIVVTSGSLSVERLRKQIDVLSSHELMDFFNMFSDVFEVYSLENDLIVTLKN